MRRESGSGNSSGPLREAGGRDGSRTGSKRQQTRGRIPRGLVAVAVSVALGALLAACGSSSDSAGGGGGGGDTSGEQVLRIGLGTEPLPNPAGPTASGQFAATVYDLAYEPIFHMTPDGEITPALATSWHYAKGTEKPNTVFEFDLREDAKFSDGTPVTAAIVARWLDFFSHSAGTFSGVFGKGARFEPVGAHTVKIQLKTPNPSLPLLMSDGGLNAGWVLGPKGMDDPEILAKETNGAGPYMLDAADSVQGDHYTYVPNPHYFDKDAIKFDKVEVKVIAEATSRLQAQVSGQIDVAEGDAQTASSAEESGLEVVGAPFNVIYLSLNLKENLSPQLNDVRVRQAMNLAIDRDSIVEALFGKYAGPTSSFIPSDAEPGLEDRWPYDPQKAKKLLAEAGYADGFTLKAIVPGAFYGNLGEPLMRAAAKNLAEVGITLDITPYPVEAEYGEALFGGAKHAVSSLGAGVEPTPGIYGVYMSPEGSVNFFGDDPELNKLYEEGAGKEDPTEGWQEMWEYYTDQSYVIPLTAYDYLDYVSDGIGGVRMGKARPIPVPTEWFPK